MADKQPTVWELEPHTGAKHAILRKYLGAWYPKLSWARKLVFIDGFAGPGEYEGGEPGSPLIALDAAIQHKANLSNCELLYLFIERDKQRFEHLDRLLDKQTVPSHVTYQTIHGEFADVLAGILDDLEQREKKLAPTFAMVDPFGFAAMPMSLMARIASHPRSELLISFMYESMNRWLTHPNLAATMNGLFGCADWREAESLSDASSRKDFLLTLYMKQLRDVTGMEYVRAFEMMDSGNRTEYFLIFSTHSLHGLKAMKAAMWAIDPSGAYQFSDATQTNQLTLIAPEPNYDLLERLVATRFSGQEVTIGQLERFVVVETAFRETHYKVQILEPMENKGKLSVVKSPRKRGRGYPPGTVIRFK